jgi:spermidine synthase
MPLDSGRRTLAVAPLFVASGAAGLIYQVLWVRELGHVLGNTLPSATLVTAVFLGGLGLGSHLGGRLVDRLHRASPGAGLLLYGRLELVVGALGLVVSAVLRGSGPVLARLSSYTCDAGRWCELGAPTWALHHLLAVLLLLPPCAAMGATLPALVRFALPADTSRAGLRVGLIYGANTLGAALGALATDLVLVPRLGVSSTERVAALLNVTAALGAWTLHRGVSEGEASPEAPAPPPRLDASARASVGLAAAALALSGAAAMGLEIVFFRYLSQLLGSLRAVFSLLVAVMLVAAFAGSLAAGALSSRVRNARVAWQVAQALLAVSTLAILLLVRTKHLGARTEEARAAIAAASGLERTVRELLWSARPIAAIAALPAFLMGFAFPLANAHVQRDSGAVGRRVGALYLGNTMGNVVGAAITGLALLPWIGIHATTAVLAALCALALVPMHLSGRARSPRADTADLASAACFVATALAVFAFALAGPRRLLAPAIPPSERGTLVVSEPTEGAYETIVLADVPGFERVLHTNGHPMSSTGESAQRYMRAMAILPLLLMDGPRSALVICFGVGNTADAVSRHPSVERIEIADLSRHVLSYAPKFEGTGGEVLRDPRVRVFVNDGRHHLAMGGGPSYDLVTLEPPPITFAGVASLYTREFFELVDKRLAPGGILSEWLPAYQAGGAAVDAVVRAFLEVFPNTVLLSGDNRELVLVGRKGRPLVLDPDAIAARLASTPGVRADLERIDMGTLVEIAGSFAASASRLRAATAQARPMTDDWPVLEHAAVSKLRATRVRADLFDAEAIDEFCPTCRARVAGLAGYLRVRAKVYRSDAFLVLGDPAARGPELDGADRRVVASSPYLRRMLGGPGFLARRAARGAIGAGRVAEAMPILERAALLEPEHPDLHELFARALLAQGKLGPAAVALDRALALDPRHAGVHALLCERLMAAGQPEAARGHCEVAAAASSPGAPDR